MATSLTSMVGKSLIIALSWATITSLALWAAEPDAASERKRGAAGTKVCFYLAKGPLDAFAASKMKLADVPLETSPLFTSEDIEQYDTDTHTFMLTHEAYRKVRQVDVPMTGKLFVVMAGDRRVYSGALWIIISSYSWEAITIIQPAQKDREELTILPGSPREPDPRNDPELLKIMRSQGKPYVSHRITASEYHREWASYQYLAAWLQDKFPYDPVSYHKVGDREFAVLLVRSSNGIRRTEFVVFHRLNHGWKILLAHNPVENEELVVEKDTSALVIKTKSGKTLLSIPP